ncbi:hypothetical protein EON66_01485 [archaeon]|nr:MAG: hypothetical protein EON66_01485 [archaeon]
MAHHPHHDVCGCGRVRRHPHGAHDPALQHAARHDTAGACADGRAVLIWRASVRTARPGTLFPGKFDKLLASHQIFHTMVFAACLVHYGNVLAHHEWRVAHSVCEL